MSGSRRSNDEPAAPPGPEVGPPALGPWQLFGVFGCVLTAVLPAFMIGSLAIHIGNDLNFAETSVGIAIGAYFATAAIGSSLLGRMGDRLGSSRTLRIAGLSSSACLLALALGAHSLGTLIAISAFGGFAMAAVQPAANATIASAFTTNRQGIGLGVKQLGVPLSTLVSGLAVPLVAITVGWRWSFAGAAVFGLCAAFLVPWGPRASTAEATSTRTGRSVAERSLSLGLVTIGLAFASASASSLGAFGIQAGRHAGLSAGTAGYIAAIGSLGAIGMYLLAGWYADCRPGRELMMIPVMLLTGATVMLVLASTEGVYSFVIIVPVAIAIGWGWPGLVNLVVVRIRPEARGSATGSTQRGAYIGAVLGPPLFGFIAETRSYGAAWLANAMLMFIAGCLFTWLRAREGETWANI